MRLLMPSHERLVIYACLWRMGGAKEINLEEKKKYFYKEKKNQSEGGDPL